MLGLLGRRVGVLLVLAVCLSPAASARQQQRPPSQSQPTFRAGIELVQIDVVVVDQKGTHIRGLKASDFVITDRKKPQTIGAFEEVTHERPRANEASAPVAAPVRMDVANNQSVQANRLVVMVIDDLHIYRGRTDLSKKIAKDVLDELGGNASMAVMFTSGENSTEVTEDRAVLVAAVDTLKGRKAIRRPTPAVDEQRPQGEGDIARANMASAQDFFDNMSKYKVLEDAARVLGSGDVRRKAFVLISEGVAKDLFGMFNAPLTPCEAKCAACPCYHDRALRQMMNSLRRSNVVSYNIDPRGHVPTNELALESFGVTLAGEGKVEAVEEDSFFRWNNPIRQAQDGLSIMAEASGGFAIVDTDNFTAGVDRIIDDLDHYYLLGFYPSDPKGSSYRPLDLTIPGHPEWTVRFRKGYRPEGPPKPPTNKNALAALMSGTLPVSSLPLRLSAVALTPASGDEARIALTIEVSAPRAALQEADGKFRDELSYEIVVVDEKKARVRSIGGQKAKLTLSSTAGDRLLPEIATYQIAQTLTLRPGRFQLRVAAESGKLASGGSVYLHLTVPDFAKQPLTMSGVAVGYAEGSRVATAVAERPRAPARRGFVLPPPPPPALPFAPTLDRTFAAADVLRVYLEVTQKDQRATRSGMLEIVKADGDKARVSMPFVPDERGRVDLQVPLSGLAPGAYVLRATVTSGAHTAVQEVGLWIKGTGLISGPDVRRN